MAEMKDGRGLRKKDNSPSEPAEKEPAEKPGKKTNEKKSKKESKKSDKTQRKRRGRGKFILFIILLLLLVALGVAVYLVVTMDLAGLRTAFIVAVNSLDPNYADYRDDLARLAEWETTLSNQKSELDEVARGLNNQKVILDQREAELAAQAEARIPIYRKPLDEEALADMQSTSKTYANMDPADAAKILASLGNIEDITAIIYFMSERSAAAILSEMDIRLAAQITNALLRDWTDE